MASLTRVLKRTGKDLGLIATLGQVGLAGAVFGGKIVKQGKTDVAVDASVKPFRKPSPAFLSPGQASISSAGSVLGGKTGEFTASGGDPADVFKQQAGVKEQESFEAEQSRLAKEKEESTSLAARRKTARRTGQGLSTILTGGRGVINSGSTVRSILRAG